MKKTGILLMIVFSLVGCGEEKEEIHDVDYYYKNFDECKKKVEQCQNNPGKLEDSPNCKNAKAAYHKRFWSNDSSTFKTPEIRVK